MASAAFTDLSGQALRLTLFKKTGCPYCAKVLQASDSLGFELPSRDIATDPSARDELVRVGGKAMVPCLFVDGQPMYESADIITFLQTKVRRSA